MEPIEKYILILEEYGFTQVYRDAFYREYLKDGTDIKMKLSIILTNTLNEVSVHPPSNIEIGVNNYFFLKRILDNLNSFLDIFGSTKNYLYEKYTSGNITFDIHKNGIKDELLFKQSIFSGLSAKEVVF